MPSQKILIPRKANFQKAGSLTKNKKKMLITSVMSQKITIRQLIRWRHAHIIKCSYAEKPTLFSNCRSTLVKRIKSAHTLHQKDTRSQEMKITVHAPIRLDDLLFMHVPLILFILQLAKKCILKFRSQKNG